jgi:hypothetical protein
MANRLVVEFTIVVFFDGTSGTVSFDANDDAVYIDLIGGTIGPRYNPGHPSDVVNLSTQAPGTVTLQSLSGSTVTLQFSQTPAAGAYYQVYGNLIY